MIFYGISFLLGSLSLWFIDSSEQAIVLLVSSSIAFLIGKCWFNKYTFCGYLFAGAFWSALNVLAWMSLSQSIVKQPKIANVQGYICSIPNYQHDNWRFDFCLSELAGSPISKLSNNKLRIRWGKYAIPPPEPPRAGQYWNIQVKVRPIHGKLNPAGFDYERWLVAEGFIGTAAIKKQAHRVNDFSPSSLFHSWRHNVYDYLNSFLPDSNQKPLMTALLMGERATITQQQWQVLQDSGTSHLLAISGLHVGIASIWSYWIVLFLWKRSAFLCLLMPAQRVAEITSILGALTIVLLSGLGLPAQRALIMLLIFIGSRWIGLNLSLASVLGFAIIVILIVDPFAPLSISFWLSFSAVFTIALVLSRLFKEVKGWLSWLKVNWYLYLAMIPIGLLFFEKISWVAIIANLVLIPLTSFVTTPILYLAALISLISGVLAKYLFLLADYSLMFTSWFQQFLSNYNLGQVGINSDLAIIVLLSAVLVLSLMPAKSLSKSPIAAIFCVLALSVLEPRKLTRFEMWVFDIGQGLAIYIDTPEGNLLFDTGWGDQDYAAARTSIMPFLTQQQILTLNKVILSHGDADHAGSLEYLLNNVEVATLISGEPIPNHTTKDCHKMQPWRWGAVNFKFLNHTDGKRYLGNNSSCVLSIEINGHKMLLPGDIEKSAENRLIANGVQTHDLVIAPHHGSKTSSTREFISRVYPQHVIFSTGYDNHWQFPKRSIVRRYQAIQSKIWVTHQDGAIRVRISENNQLIVSSLRAEKPRFWR